MFCCALRGQRQRQKQRLLDLLLAVLCSFRPRLQPVEQLAALDGEERMWDAEEQRNIRWGRLAASVALLVGGGMLLGRSAALRGPAAAQQPGAPVAAAVAKAAAPALSLSRGEAAAVIGRWQEAKAAALGPKHDIKGLSSILRGQVLDQWRERAQQIQKKGW